MSPIERLFQRIEDTTESSLKKGLIMFCSLVFLLAFLGVYKTHYDQFALADKAKQTIVANNRINAMVNRKLHMDQEKEAIAESDGGQSGKDLVTTIDSAAQDLEIDLDAGYKKSLKTVSIPHEEDFVEQQVTIKTDKLSLKKIITLINSLRNENSVMFRDVKIENKGKLPACQIMLSMRKKK